jgi:hypothetical protein
MTSDIRVGRGSKVVPKIERYRVGQGRPYDLLTKFRLVCLFYVRAKRLYTKRL